MSVIKRSAESCPYLEFLLQKLQKLEGWPLLTQVLQYFIHLFFFFLKLFQGSRPPRKQKVLLPFLLRLPFHVYLWVNVGEKAYARARASWQA